MVESAKSSESADILKGQKMESRNRSRFMGILVFFSFFAIVVGRETTCLGQDKIPDDLLFELLTDSKANIFRIPGENESLVPATPRDLALGRLFVEMYDSFDLGHRLEQVRDIKADQVLLIGNSTANLQLRDFCDVLASCDTVRIVILDSVDCDFKSLQTLQELAPDMKIYFSERTALRCVNKSYAFAEDRNISLAVRNLDVPSDLEFLDRDLFSVGIKFIGREWHPEYIDVLPRDAIRYFRHMRHLESVALSGTELVDSDLSALANLKSLKALSLAETSVVGDGLKLVPGEELTALNLEHTPLLTHIPFDRFPKLERLWIDGTSRGFAVLDSVHACDRLSEIFAGGVPCSTEQLQRLLDGLPALRWLHLGEISQSDGGPTLDSLINEFPQTTITHGKIAERRSRKNHE